MIFLIIEEFLKIRGCTLNVAGQTTPNFFSSEEFELSRLFYHHIKLIICRWAAFATPADILFRYHNLDH